MNSKRILIIILAFVMTITACPAVLSLALDEKSAVGDVNGNGEIDSMDYVLLKRAYFGTYGLNDISVGDINGNGKIDSMDYVYLRRAYFGTYIIQTPEDDEPESSVPESSKPDVSEPDDSSVPESSEPDVSEPSESFPASSEPSESVSESSEPDDSTSEPENSEHTPSIPSGEAVNLTQGKAYVANGLYSEEGVFPYPDENGKSMTDGTVADKDAIYSDVAFAGFNINTDYYQQNGCVSITADLGSLCYINKMIAFVSSVNEENADAGVGVPTTVEFYVSADKTVWTKAGEAVPAENSTDTNATLNIATSVSGRYIQYRFKNSTNWIMVSEVEAYGICADPDATPENPLTLTQTSVIANENFTYVEAFSEFLATAEKSILLPGLTEPIVPQGLARNPETGYVYVTAYYSDSSKPSVILVMDPNGKFVAEYFVYNANGTAYTGHMGGICVTENYLYFSGPSVNGNYTVAEFNLDDLSLSGSHNVTIGNTVAIPLSPSYLFYDDGILWAGNFYLEGSYDLGKLFNFKTGNADGTQYGGYAAAFEVDKTTKRLTVDSEAGYARPFHVIATPDKVQGFAYKDGKVALSISYGRNNNSTLGFYNVNLNASKTTITADGITYPLTILDSTNRVKNVTTMCMTEGVTLTADGKLLILYESAAQKYYNSKNPTDYIWEYSFPD